MKYYVFSEAVQISQAVTECQAEKAIAAWLRGKGDRGGEKKKKKNDRLENV